VRGHAKFSIKVDDFAVVFDSGRDLKTKMWRGVSFSRIPVRAEAHSFIFDYPVLKHRAIS
jgi:hypothetical protein